jgi:hypothetical protein
MTEQNVYETYLEEGSNQATASATVIDKSKGWILGLLIAVNLVATVAMYNAWRDAAMESRLKQYDLDWFKANDLAVIKTRLAVMESKCTK